MGLNKPNHRPPKTRRIDISEMSNESFFTIYEVADLLKLHHITIRRMIKSGELPAVKVGRQWRISKETLEKYVSK